MQAVEIKNLTFGYSDRSNSEKVLKNINLTINQGEFIALLGRNGSGKSTLAKMINGLLTPDDENSEVSVFGLSTKNPKNLFDIRKRAGMVFQNPDNQMVAGIVEDDIAFGPENIGLPREEIGKRIDFALAAVGMSEFRRSTPTRLSGGQKQRIAIAGVLAIKPDILILDESTAMLDPRGRKEVMTVINRLNKEENMTIILITHFMEEALCADRIIALNRGEIVLNGKPEDVFSHADILESYGLSLPKPLLIAKKLQKSGVPVKDVFTDARLGEELCGLLRKK